MRRWLPHALFALALSGCTGPRFELTELPEAPIAIVYRTVQETERVQELLERQQQGGGRGGANPTGFEIKAETLEELAGVRRPEDALRESDTHWLLWRTEASLPDNLLALDTPDIDSEVRINWERADQIRRSADVLVAILTQQKYNDAAVKEFFRRAAAEDKAVIIVFNQTQLPEDEQYWPLWVGTFCDETGIRPEHVYLAPYDRKAAEENRLPFYERAWPPAVAEENGAPVLASNNEPRDLLADLSRLRFDEIKLRTLEGSLHQLLDETAGVPSYLREIEQRSDEFRSAHEMLAAHQLAEIGSWPPIPNSLLVGEIRQWWALQREGWPARVHGFYNAIGKGLTWEQVKAARPSRDYDTEYDGGRPPDEFVEAVYRSLIAK